MKSEMGKIDVNYKCSVCGGLVEVVKHDHAEPEIKRSCGHEGAIVHEIGRASCRERVYRLV